MGILGVVPASSSGALGSWSPDRIGSKRLLPLHVGGAWDYSLVGITLMLAIVANERGWTRIAGGLAGLAFGIALVIAVRNQHWLGEARRRQAPQATQRG
jgi:hypothetical protein